MNKLSIYRCSLFISLYVRYYLVSKYSKNFEQYWNDTQVFMCLLLYFKFQSVPSGRPLDLTAQNIDPTNKNPSIYYCGRYLDLPTACLHINTPYDCAIQGRGAEVPNHQCHCPGFRRGDISCDSAEEGGWKNCRDLSLSLVIAFHVWLLCSASVGWDGQQIAELGWL